ncbi:MAG: SoxR reducing system RseC family protein [Candidatus Omnitrophota bacterium]|nr:MAG: SoxR reducing system RseC family protein [Candidatus Omnitrophota bacterium]
MFKETVDVVEVTPQKVRIKFQKRPMCSCCKSIHICNVDRKETLLIPNTKGIPLKKGDKIEVGIEEGRTFFAVVILFLIPAVFFLSFLILTRGENSILSFFIAIFAVILYYLCVRRLIKNKDKIFNLRILRKL